MGGQEERWGRAQHPISPPRSHLQHHPFDAGSLSALGQKIMKGAYTPISPKYSASLRTLVTSLLAVNPSARPSVGDILVQVCLPCLSGWDR